MKRDPAADRDRLQDRLAEALGQMVEMTCPAMRALWLALSRKERERQFDPVSMPSVYPEHLLQIRASSRTKYQALAGWRHVMVWQGLLDEEPGSGTEQHSAMRRIFFTPCPNDPPFSYSSKASDIPDLRRGEAPGLIKREAKAACWRSIKRLCELCREKLALGDEEVAAFVRLGFRDSLNDVLKLEDHWGKKLDPESPGGCA